MAQDLRPILSCGGLRWFAVVSDPSYKAWSAVLGWISGLLAESSAALVESSVRLAFWVDLGARSGRFGALFVLTRSVHPSDGLWDPILGPLGAVLDPFLGLLGFSWALLGGRTSRAEGPEEA